MSGTAILIVIVVVVLGGGALFVWLRHVGLKTYQSVQASLPQLTQQQQADTLTKATGVPHHVVKRTYDPSVVTGYIRTLSDPSADIQRKANTLNELANLGGTMLRKQFDELNATLTAFGRALEELDDSDDNVKLLKAMVAAAQENVKKHARIIAPPR